MGLHQVLVPLRHGLPLGLRALHPGPLPPASRCGGARYAGTGDGMLASKGVRCWAWHRLFSADQVHRKTAAITPAFNCSEGHACPIGGSSSWLGKLNIALSK